MKSVKTSHGKNVIFILLIMTLIFFFSDVHNKNTDSCNNNFKSIAFAKKKSKTKFFTLNFKAAELSEFLNLMSQLIGKNIIINDNVRGKITITSVKKFPVSHAYEILKSILEIKGLAVIETPSLIKIVPVKDAIKKNVEIYIDGKKQELKHGEEKTITFLLKIEHADAKEIAATLKSLKSKNTDIVIYSTLNTIILCGTSSEINGLVKIANELDREIEEEEEEKIIKGNIHIVHLQNADAEQLAGVLSRVPFSENAKISRARPPKVRKSAKAKRTTKTQSISRSQPKTKLSIISNKETNSLIITATPTEFKEIKRLIKELDIVREQVLIEALIIEISADNSWDFGMQWMLGDQTGDHIYGGSGILNPGALNFSTPEGMPAGKSSGLPLNMGFQIGYLSGKDVLGFALLNLSETDSNYNVLSTPQILTIDNHEAEMNIGEEIPVTSNSRVSDSGQTFESFEYKSVGLKLKITPHITNNQMITLDFYQEANDVIGEGNLPRLTKRDFQTKVTIANGKTIVIGGLIKNKKDVTETKIPILGNIPILGWLFKYRKEVNRKTNLLVFITPHIVTKEEKIDAITKQKREEQNRLKFKKFIN